MSYNMNAIVLIFLGSSSQSYGDVGDPNSTGAAWPPAGDRTPPKLSVFSSSTAFSTISESVDSSCMPVSKSLCLFLRRRITKPARRNKTIPIIIPTTSPAIAPPESACDEEICDEGESPAAVARAVDPVPVNAVRCPSAAVVDVAVA
jgi:hypothetical protein